MSSSTAPSHHTWFSGHLAPINAIIIAPDEDLLITASDDCTLRIFSTFTGKCLNVLQGHTKPVQDIALFNDHTVVSVSTDGSTRFWNIKDGILKNTVAGGKDCVAVLNSEIFVNMSYPRDWREKGVVLVYKITDGEGTKVDQVSTFEVHERAVTVICVWKDRFVTGGYDGRVKIWQGRSWDGKIFESDATLEKHLNALGAVPPGTRVECVSMNDEFVVLGLIRVLLIGGITSDLFVYDSNTFELLHAPGAFSFKGDRIDSVHLLSSGGAFLSTFRSSRTVRLYDIKTATLIWETKPYQSISNIASAIFSDGRIVLTNEAEIVVLALPDQAIERIECNISSKKLEIINAIPPLQRAFATCITGEDTPVNMCTTLISYEACVASFEEWLCAHKLLVMAVADGDIPGSNDFHGQISFWYENLYLALKDVPMTSAKELNIAKRCLSVAKNLNLIEGVDTVLGPLHVTNAFDTKVQTLQHTGEIIFERLLQAEGRLYRLKESFEKYRTFQKYSQLVSIALHIIPIAGGAVAGVVSTGSNIVQEFTAGRVTKFAMDLGTDFTQHSTSFGENLLIESTHMLSSAAIEAMKPFVRRRLEDALLYCGMKISDLQKMLLERAQAEHPSRTSSIGETKEIIVDVTEPEELLPHTLPFEHDFDVYDTHVQDMLDKNDISMVSDHSVSSYRNIPLEKCSIARLSRKELAETWAAFVLEYNDRRVEEFNSIRDCIYRALEKEEILPAVFVNRGVVSKEDLFETALKTLQEEGGIHILSLGAKARLKIFIDHIDK